jgi:rare lipoprotein A (peptidoglycan hydrolase)
VRPGFVIRKIGVPELDVVCARAGACAGVMIRFVLLAALVVGGCASTGSARVTGLEPYRVNGQRYVPLRDWRGYAEEGVASWYGAAHHGRRTASGERFDAYGALTAAHRTLPFNVCAEVENLRTGKSAIVRINDRGPFARGRVIDLSKAAASEIGLLRSGVAKVRVEAVGVANAKGECRAS